MIGAVNAVLAIDKTSLSSSGSPTSVSGIVKRHLLLVLAEHANHACATEHWAQHGAESVERCRHTPNCAWTCFVGICVIVNETGYSESTVKRGLQQIAQDGWIDAKRLGRGVLYCLNQQLLHVNRYEGTKRRDTTGVTTFPEPLRERTEKVPPSSSTDGSDASGGGRSQIGVGDTGIGVGSDSPYRKDRKEPKN